MQALLNAEIDQIEHKIADLDVIRQDLRRGLLGLREEELELDDERELSPLISDPEPRSNGSE